MIDVLYNATLEAAGLQYLADSRLTEPELQILGERQVAPLLAQQLGLAVPIDRLNSVDLLQDLVDSYIVHYQSLSDRRDPDETSIGNDDPRALSASEGSDYREMEPEAYQRAMDSGHQHVETRGDQATSSTEPPAEDATRGIWDNRTAMFRLPRTFEWWRAACFTPNQWTQFLRDGNIPQSILDATKIPVRPPSDAISDEGGSLPAQEQDPPHEDPGRARQADDSSDSPYYDEMDDGEHSWGGFGPPGTIPPDMALPSWYGLHHLDDYPQEDYRDPRDYEDANPGDDHFIPSDHGDGDEDVPLPSNVG